VVVGILALALALSPQEAARSVPPQPSPAQLCREAQQHLSERSYEQARKAAQKALDIDPHSAEAEDLLGTAEFALGNLGAAERHLRRALEIDPRLAAARRSLAATYLKRKRFDDARREFARVLEFNPRDFVSLYSLGLTSLLQDRPQEALTHFEKAHRLNPGEPSLLIGMLQAQLKLQQEERVRITLAELDARLRPRDPRRLQLGALLASEGAYELAVIEFERLHEAQPDSYEIGYNLALAYHRAGKEDEASVLLESLVAGNEKGELLNLQGDVEESRGNHARALEAFWRAAELEPRNEDYRFDYANALVRRGNFDKASEAFAAGTRDFPGSVRMTLGWGAAYYLAGRYEQAAQTLLHAVEIAPRSPEVYYLLGRAYDAAGTFQESIARAFRDHLQTEPGDAWAHLFFGKILLARARQSSPRDLGEAERHLTKAIALDGKLSEAHLALGDLFESRGQLDAARRELERAVALDPKSSAAYYKLAQIYRKLGRPDRSKAAIEKFQQLKDEAEKRNQEQVRSLLDRVK
jgi:tetratricopeptide (TPR) repeat protein